VEQSQPLPEQLPKPAEDFLKSRGVTEYKIICEDGRSYVVVGLNKFMGETRPFLCRIFLNGYVRDWIALPAEYAEEIAAAIVKYAKGVEG